LIYSRIAGTGSYLPEKVITNHDLEKLVDTTDEWIRTRTGIERRHVAAEGETTVDLAEHAARRALDAAGIAPTDVDFIAFGTTTPDLIFPNCGTLLQQRLGCRGAPAFSLETACAGFMYAMSIADKYVRCGESRRALVVGAETLSRITDWSDRATAVLFADGAGAVVLEASEVPGVLSTHLHSDGQYKDLLYCGSGVSRGFQSKLAISMAGSEVFKIAVHRLGQAVDEALAANGLERSALDWFVPHQANIRIIESASTRLGIDAARTIVNIDRYGNTSAASIPLALAEAADDGRLRDGDLVLMSGFGAGMTWASALLQWGRA